VVVLIRMLFGNLLHHLLELYLFMVAHIFTEDRIVGIPGGKLLLSLSYGGRYKSGLKCLFVLVEGVGILSCDLLLPVIIGVRVLRNNFLHLIIEGVLILGDYSSLPSGDVITDNRAY